MKLNRNPTNPSTNPAVPGIPTLVSLAVILVVLAITTVASLIKTRNDPAVKAHAGSIRASKPKTRTSESSGERR
jgi:tellurite resistance protein TerC